MITLDISKPKTITLVTQTTGIDPAQLDYTLRVMIEGVEYGFPCQKKLDKVIATIPALSEVVKGIKPGKYKVKIEATGQNKYYMCPFNESVEIVAVPKVSMKVEETKNEETLISSDSSVSMSIVEQEDGAEVVSTPEPEVSEPIKKSKFTMGLIDKLKG